MSSSASAAAQAVAPGTTPLHRKAQVGRAEHQARAMSLAKALRLTLPRVAEDLFELSLSVIGVRSDTCDGDAIAEHLGQDGLLMLLDGPSRRRAAAIFDPVLVTALIQQQTMGKVLPQMDPVERPLTPTDAAIASPFLDKILERAGPVPEKLEEQELISGFSFGAWVDDPRVLAMSLDAPEYALINLTVDIAGGVGQGTILLCMPKGIGREEELTLGLPEEESDGGARPGSAQLTTTVMGLNADLRVCLAQMRMPLRAIGAFQVDQVLEIGTTSFEGVSVQTAQGKTVGRGTLGMLDGKRAVQLVATKKTGMQMRRRASDREDLDLPDISDPSTSDVAMMEAALAEPPPMADAGGLPDLPDLPAFEDPPALPDLPDLGDSGAGDLPDLPDLPELTDLPDLPELDDFPDLSDLPELDVG